MVMPASGPLNMGGTSSPVSVAQELGLSLTATISMNQANVRTLAGVGGSGTTWSMSSLYGKSNGYTIEYLVVGGGAGGGFSAQGGGGGAGGYRTATGILVGSGSSFAVTVGAGGAQNTNGSASLFNSMSSAGGGRGGGGFYGDAGGAGGSGGGGYGGGAAGGAGNTPATSPAQGYNGRNSVQFWDFGFFQGYGGGASGSVPPVGYGMSGATWSNGNTYAGGGGPAGYGTNGNRGFGGLGGGGNGILMNGDDSLNRYGTNGTANTGGGGGGGSNSYQAISGGSGIVIIRYLGAQRGSGGAVTSAGGYTYHTFTSSGTFTA